MITRTHVAATLTLASVVTLSACGGGSTGASSSGSVDKALSGATFVVSSKDFTESILLGKITAAVLKAHGATITDKTNIKGSVTPVRL